MEKKELLFVCFLLLLAIIVRFAFWNPLYYGADFFYHASIVDQAVERGSFDTTNHLALCYEGTPSGHPPGFLFISYLLSTLFGSYLTFLLLPVLLGLLSLLLFYLLIKTLFSRTVALWSLFFAAVSLAFVSRTHPFVYRGDAVVYPFLLLALLFLVLFLREPSSPRRHWYALGSGLSSGLTAVLWSGAPLVLVTYLVCLIASLLVIALSKTLRTTHLLFSFVSLGSQAAVAYSLLTFVSLQGKIVPFLSRYYWFFVLCFFCFLAVLFFVQKHRTLVPLFVLAGIGILAFIVFWNTLLPLLSGFGSIRSIGDVPSVFETQSPTFYQFYTYFFLTLLAMPFGLLLLFRSFDERRAVFVGWLLVSLFLLFSAQRYFFFASLPLLALAGLFVGTPRYLGKKFNLAFFVGIILIIALIGFAIYIYPAYFEPVIEQKQLDAFTFLRTTTEERACILSPDTRGSTIEYFAHRYYYFHPLGIDPDRWEKGYTFLFTNRTIELGVDGPLYVLLMDSDLSQIASLLYSGKVPGTGTFAALQRDNETFYTASSVSISFDLTPEGEILATTDDYAFDVVVDFNAVEPKVFRTSATGLSPLGGFFYNHTYYARNGTGCAFFGRFIPQLPPEVDVGFYFDESLCQSRFYRILTGQALEGTEQVYFKEDIAIYRVLSSGRE